MFHFTIQRSLFFNIPYNDNDLKTNCSKLIYLNLWIEKSHGVSNWSHLNSLQTFFCDIDFDCFTQESTYPTFYFVELKLFKIYYFLVFFFFLPFSSFYHTVPYIYLFNFATSFAVDSFIFHCMFVILIEFSFNIVLYRKNSESIKLKEFCWNSASKWLVENVIDRTG